MVFVTYCHRNIICFKIHRRNYQDLFIFPTFINLSKYVLFCFVFVPQSAKVLNFTFCTPKSDTTFKTIIKLHCKSGIFLSAAKKQNEKTNKQTNKNKIKQKHTIKKKKHTHTQTNKLIKKC